MKRNDILNYKGIYELRIMAIAEGWVMVRRKGFAPFLIALREAQKYPIAPAGQRPKGWKLLTGISGENDGT